MLSADLDLLVNHGVDLGMQVLAAILCGGLLGYERQRKAKSVGILTSIMVALGSTVIVLASTLFALDNPGTGEPTRIPSMIVSGIGFIGAGAILRSKFSVTGLASAATIWSLGGLGILIGWGHVLLALVLAVVFFSLLHLIPKLEHMLSSEQFCLHIDVVLKKNRVNDLLSFFLGNHVPLSGTRISTEGDQAVLSINECGVEHKGELLSSLHQVEGVLSVVDRSATGVR